MGERIKGNNIMKGIYARIRKSWFIKPFSRIRRSKKVYDRNREKIKTRKEV